jgi:putative transcriptional regulator
MIDLSGKLLISPPKVRGNFWQKTVIFVTESNNRGSVGLVLNRTSQMSIKEFSNQYNMKIDIPGFMHVGGPVNVKALTMLHTAEWSCDNTMMINNEYALSSSQHLLSNLAMGNAPRKWRLFVGLCGWTAGQLENEIQGQPPYDHTMSWLTTTASEDLVFDLDGQTQWTEAIEKSGTEFAQSILAI